VARRQPRLRADCDLLLPAKNGECQAFNNTNFGLAVPGSTYDPDLMNGWGKRTYNWEFSAGVQHELVPRVSAEVAYFRRWYGNFVVRDNRALAASDFNQYSITAPNSGPARPRIRGHGVAGVARRRRARGQLRDPLDAWQADRPLGGGFNPARALINVIIQGGEHGTHGADNCGVIGLTETNRLAFFIAETPLSSVTVTNDSLLRSRGSPRIRSQGGRKYPGRINRAWSSRDGELFCLFWRSGVPCSASVQTVNIPSLASMAIV
jgi:hypothetical protein